MWGPLISTFSGFFERKPRLICPGRAQRQRGVFGGAGQGCAGASGAALQGGHSPSWGCRALPAAAPTSSWHFTPWADSERWIRRAAPVAAGSEHQSRAGRQQRGPGREGRWTRLGRHWEKELQRPWLRKFSIFANKTDPSLAFYETKLSQVLLWHCRADIDRVFVSWQIFNQIPKALKCSWCCLSSCH